MALTKEDLTGKFHGDTGLTIQESKKLVDSIFEIMKDELAKGNPVNISGFGKWSVLSKRDRMGRNPQTGESITIKARKVLSFKASNVLRDMLV